jgi:uncharacterized membrane protein
VQETNPSSLANTENAQIPVQEHSPTRVLFRHEPHQHQPRNVNLLMEAEQAASGFNSKLAVTLTQGTGTMWTAYAFAVLAIIGLFGLLGWLNPFVFLLTTWISQQFLQLVLLPVILVGQNVLSHKAELQADEEFRTTMSTYHDIEQIMQHLSAQDAELMRHAKMLIHLLEKNGISLQQLEAEVGKTSQLEAYTGKLPTNAPVNPAPTEEEKSST